MAAIEGVVRKKVEGADGTFYVAAQDTAVETRHIHQHRYGGDDPQICPEFRRGAVCSFDREKSSCKHWSCKDWPGKLHHT